ncbi:hypothetical protein JB92DRAFT_3125762 [Gautieria morchelliformis]|nr:hypothetical protein JB92DRAFT_3125762 [Gautieria morchelliformis]
MAATPSLYSGPGMPGGIPYGDMSPSSTPSSDSPYPILTSRTNMPENTMPRRHRGSIQEQIARKMREQAERDSATDMIDPNLPSTFEALRAALTPAPSLNKSTHEEPSEDEEDDDDPYADLRSVRPGDVKQLVATIKSTKRFKPESAADLDRFAMSDLPTQLILTAAWLLEVRDNIITGPLEPSAWKIPSALQTDIKKYAHCVILSPFLTSYQGSVPTKSVMAAMWELSISSLPPEKEAHKMKVVVSAIGTQLTNARNLIKTEVLCTLNDDCLPAECHIAALCHSIIAKSKTGLKVTVHVHMRMALLRAALDRHQSVSPDKMSSSVDSEMRDLESQSTSKEERATHLKAILELDITDHPRPADEHLQYPTTATKDLEEWQKICDRHAGKVEVEIKRAGRSRR